MTRTLDSESRDSGLNPDPAAKERRKGMQFFLKNLVLTAIGTVIMLVTLWALGC